MALEFEWDAGKADEREAIALLDGNELPLVSRFASMVTSRSPRKLDFEERFRRIMEERRWLVHKGGLALVSKTSEAQALARPVARFAATAGAATELSADLRWSLEERLGRAGLSSEEVQQRMNEVIRRWLGA